MSFPALTMKSQDNDIGTFIVKLTRRNTGKHQVHATYLQHDRPVHFLFFTHCSSCGFLVKKLEN